MLFRSPCRTDIAMPSAVNNRRANPARAVIFHHRADNRMLFRMLLRMLLGGAASGPCLTFGAGRRRPLLRFFILFSLAYNPQRPGVEHDGPHYFSRREAHPHDLLGAAVFKDAPPGHYLKPVSLAHNRGELAPSHNGRGSEHVGAERHAGLEGSSLQQPDDLLDRKSVG